MDMADKEGRFMSDSTNFPSGRGIVELIGLRYKAEALHGCFNLCQVENHTKSLLSRITDGCKECVAFVGEKDIAGENRGDSGHPSPSSGLKEQFSAVFSGWSAHD